MKTNRIIVCGGRDYSNRERVREILLECLPSDDHREPPTIVHGGARGADELAGEVATSEGFWVEIYPANWKRSPRGAGPIRNERMAMRGADLCIAFPGGKGTADMVRRAERYGIPVEKIDW